MDPGIPTSFIPKRPIESGVAPSLHHGRRSVGILSFLTFIIVVGTGLAVGLTFVYQKQLVAQKTALNASIAQARDGIGTEFVYDMKRLDARIDGVQSLIDNHIVVTPIFKALEASTLRTIQYKDFGYTIKTDPATKSATVEVALSGSAKNYASIALQSDAFSTSTLIKNPVFSNLTVDDKTRQVNFKLVFSVNTTDLSYEAFINGMIKKQQVVVPPGSEGGIPPEMAP
jgi:hypothetical protein